jgi:hypothetical protein
MIGVGRQLLQPVLRNEDSFFLICFILRFEAFIIRILDDVFHILILEGAHHSEKELSLRVLAR